MSGDLPTWKTSNRDYTQFHRVYKVSKQGRHDQYMRSFEVLYIFMIFQILRCLFVKHLSIKYLNLSLIIYD